MEGKNGNSHEGYVETDGKKPKTLVLSDILVIGVVFLAASGGFMFGYLYGKESAQVKGVWIEDLSQNTEIGQGQVAGASVTVPTKASEFKAEVQPVPVIAVPEGGMYVASRNGEVYYLPWCGSAKNIKEENRIWFSSKAEAEAAGYRPAKNCKGI